MFTVHFHKIENNDIQQRHSNTFIRYTNTSTCFGPEGPKPVGMFVYLINILKFICWMSLFSNSYNN
jgi:hypothetical protein